MGTVKKILKQTKDYIFIFVVLSLSILGSAQTSNTGFPCWITNNSFTGGEKLVYKIYYNLGIIWIPAGEVVFKVFDHGDTYLVTGEGKSYKSYDWFFKVRDHYATILDKKTLSPLSFVRNIYEGGFVMYDSIFFDYQNDLIQNINGKTKDQAKQYTFERNDCVMDLLSVFYRLRNTNIDQYAPGDKMKIDMFIDRQKYPITVVYEADEQKNIHGLGDHRCMRIRPKLIVGNVFKEKDVMHIWVSKDKNKIPLLIESPISVGAVKAVLKSYSGLRYPLSSKIE